MFTPLLAPAALALAAAPATTVPSAPATAPAAEMPLAPPPRARRVHTPGDPLEGFNRVMFGIYEGLDKVIYRPAAITYKTVVPKPVRTGLRHVLSNLTEPVVFVAYLLEGKPKRAGQTFARFAINSTVGLGGIIDVAKSKSVDLPHHNNGFGAVLGVWGVKPGPYVFLPVIGPSSLRDLLGTGADGVLLPYTVGKPFDRTDYQTVTAVIGGLDQRAESDAELKALFADAVDRYATLRSVWQQNRAAEIDEIKHGPDTPSQATTEFDDPLTDPEQAGKAPLEAKAPDSSARELADPLTDPAAPTPEPTPQPAQPQPSGN